MLQIHLIAAVTAGLLLTVLTSNDAVSAQSTAPEPARKVRARLKVGTWKEYPTRALSDLKGFTPPSSPAALDKYGVYREKVHGTRLF
jgi:hypothetical protein